MLGDFLKAEKIYLACGYTDLRNSIEGLASIVQQNCHLDPFSNSLFLFCGHRCDWIKVLYWEGDSFVLLYKRLENGRFQWPRSRAEVRWLTDQELGWMLEGLAIDQPKAVRRITPFIRMQRIGRTVFMAMNLVEWKLKMVPESLINSEIYKPLIAYILFLIVI